MASMNISARDHQRGGPHALVTLLEYGDYESLDCGQAYLIIKRLQQELGVELRFVFRNFPVRKTHPNAEMAAEAAESAAIQGKFWEMHDLIFENQQDLQPEDLMRYGRDVGLDLERFGKHLYDRTFGARVTEDFQNGIRAGVNTTPTFFINGVKFEQDWSYDSLLRAIRSELDHEIIRRAI